MKFLFNHFWISSCNLYVSQIALICRFISVYCRHSSLHALHYNPFYFLNDTLFRSQTAVFFGNMNTLSKCANYKYCLAAPNTSVYALLCVYGAGFLQTIDYLCQMSLCWIWPIGGAKRSLEEKRKGSSFIIAQSTNSSSF